MQASNRIIVNTLAQYIRTILNVLLSLYSTRLVLETLGVQDMGIYSLVAGVVSMLSFLTNSLVNSTQRFLSFNQGKGDINKLQSVFSNSLILHISLGFIILIVLGSCTPLLFHGFLNIPIDRVYAAKFIYLLVIVMVYISFITAPYRALLVSRENIVYTSVVDVIDGIFKVGLVVLMQFVKGDKLITYGWMMLFISSFNFGAFSIYCHIKYSECIFPKLSFFSISYIKELSSYTGWIVYSTACIALRNQGVAIVLNRAIGTAINAAYGIGNQISGMVSFVSSSLCNAISPQLTASEGKGDRNRMWMLAGIQSKFSFLLLAMIGIPTIFEMQTILGLWLIVVPDYTALFASTFLIMQMVDMLTTGLGFANRAMGKIGWYTIWTYTPKLIILPIGWILLKIGYSLEILCIVLIFVEIIVMLMRVPLLRQAEGFRCKEYVINIILKSIAPAIIVVGVCFGVCYFIHSPLRFFVNYLIGITIFVICAYKFSLSELEKNKIDSIIRKVLKK